MELRNIGVVEYWSDGVVQSQHCAWPSALHRAHLGTVPSGPRTVPVRSAWPGTKAQTFCSPPQRADVLRTGTVRAPTDREPSRFAAGRRGEYAGMFRTTSAWPRAADGDRPRSGGSIEMRPTPPLQFSSTPTLH